MATTENTETQNTVRELLQDNFPDVDLEAGDLVGSGALDGVDPAGQPPGGRV